MLRFDQLWWSKLGRDRGKGVVNARQRFSISLLQHFGVAGSSPCARAGRAAKRPTGGEIDRIAVTSFR